MKQSEIEVDGDGQILLSVYNLVLDIAMALSAKMFEEIKLQFPFFLFVVVQGNRLYRQPSCRWARL